MNDPLLQERTHYTNTVTSGTSEVRERSWFLVPEFQNKVLLNHELII